MWTRIDVHLTLEVLHNIQKDIVNIRAVMELDFDGVEVAKRIRDIEQRIGNAIHVLRRRLGSWLDVILPFC
jgi:two-component SAPR family response regulator